MTDDAAHLLRKDRCINPSCGSSDAMAIYSDGHGFCYSCQTRFSSRKLIAAGVEGVPEGGDDADYSRARNTMTHSSAGARMIQGKPQALAKRRLTEDTASKWGYKVGDFNGRPTQFAEIRDDEGRVIAQKLRLPSKDFPWLGDKDAAPGLWGKHLWSGKGKKIIITEGEIDAMTVSQLQEHKWPVVSVLRGAGGAYKDIKRELQWLDGYEQVVLMFDNDEAGAEATEKCVPLFKPGRVFVATLPLKDPSEMLQAGRGRELIEAIWQAKPWRPDGVVNAADLWDLFNAEDDPGMPYPWEGLTTMTMGLRARELVTLTAGSGIGKSTVCRELAHWLLAHGETVGYIALEESNRKTLKELVGLLLNRRLLQAPKEGPDAVPAEDLRAAFEQLTAGNRLFLYDHFGSLNSERLLGHIRYMAVSLGVRWVVLDHLSIVVSGDESMTDERRGIDLAMTKLRSLVEETGIGLILVSHLKRPDGKGHEEGAPTSLAQLRGSAGIAQLSDMVVGLERNQQDPSDRNQMGVRVLKNRYTGETGEAAVLEYNTQTGRLSEVAQTGGDEYADHFDPADGY